MNHLPESLSLWDRLFNRYRRSIISRGQSVYKTTGTGYRQTEYLGHWVDYHVIDRLTGSETVERKWLGRGGTRGYST